MSNHYFKINGMKCTIERIQLKNGFTIITPNGSEITFENRRGFNTEVEQKRLMNSLTKMLNASLYLDYEILAARLPFLEERPSFKNMSRDMITNSNSSGILVQLEDEFIYVHANIIRGNDEESWVLNNEPRLYKFSTHPDYQDTYLTNKGYDLVLNYIDVNNNLVQLEERDYKLFD